MPSNVQTSEFERVKSLSSLKAYAEDNLERAARGNAYICPFCASGGHGNANSDSAFSIKGERFKCFGCNTGGDIFDLAGQLNGIDPNDKVGQLEAVASWVGVDIGLANPNAAPTRQQPTKARDTIKPLGGSLLDRIPTKMSLKQGRDEEKAYLLQARQNIDNPEAVSYLAERGFTLEDADIVGMGYDPSRKRLVLPWWGSDFYHIDRDITGKAAHKYVKPATLKVGEQPLFDPQALNNDDGVVFVTEGALDAYAIALAGGFAVALGGVGTHQLITALQAMHQPPISILALDQDEAGRVAQERAEREFEDAHMPYMSMVWLDVEGKDPAEMRKCTPEEFVNSVLAMQAHAMAARREEQETAYREAMAALKVVNSGDIVNRIWNLEDAVTPIPTGFASLDTALGGGLPAGLVTLGAVSSMGKTTFALQMADTMATAGHRVLFVTIEQSARELISKSVSRLTYTMLGGQGLGAGASEIGNPAKRACWDESKSKHLFSALTTYWRDISPYLDILEGVEQPNVSDIGTVARTIAGRYGQAPVICIDYLQLLKPQSERDTDKQAIDKNVMALRQLARELRTPVVVISSLNRASYSTGVSLESFKESGAIEYGSDVLLGLQPRNMGEDLAALDERHAKGEARKLMREHKSKHVRKSELVVLKNRNGSTPNGGIPFDFKAKANLWVESSGEENPF